jgi:hypothetical protein
MTQEQEIIAFSCREVQRELANYVEDDISPGLRVRIERRFTECRGCQATYDSLRKIIRLTANGEVLELPEAFSRRLFQRIAPL